MKEEWEPKRARVSQPLLTVVYETKDDRSRVQVLLENIKHKVRKTNGEIIEDALSRYYEQVKAGRTWK